MEPKYPNAKVVLSETNGNAYAILSKARKALKLAGVPEEEIDKFKEEAKSGSYDDMLSTIYRWMEVE